MDASPVAGAEGAPSDGETAGMTAPVASGGARRRGLRKLWLSPPNQPGYARPALFAITALATFFYAWQLDDESLEQLYSASARSMALSWHNFFFGSVDPAGTVTLDKLPGAIWLQALSVKVFGFSNAAVVAPQVIEGVVTVVILYRAVQLLAGPLAAVVAAGVQAVSPAAIALNRGNIPDTLMIMLAVLAAEATARAVIKGGTRHLLLAGLFVGLAFQAKMIEAWVFLVPIGLCYLWCGAPRLVRRIGDLACMGTVTVLVSLSWMTIVTLVPASSRPAVDGSTDNSIFQQVFSYNGFTRFSQGGLPGLKVAPFVVYQHDLGKILGGTLPGPGWNRLLAGPLAHDVAWLLPAAAISLVSLLVMLRRSPRRDPVFAATIFWGAWLAVFFLLLSDLSRLNAYYVAVLCPAVAAVIGIGISRCATQSDRSRRLAGLLAAGVGATAGYSLWLVPGITGIRPEILIIGSLAAVIALTAIVWQARRSERTAAAWNWALGLCLVAVMVCPLFATWTVVANGEGPFDTPFERPALITDDETGVNLFQSRLAFFGGYLYHENLGHEPEFYGAVDTSSQAGAYITGTGLEFLPIGGYTGGLSTPTLATIEHLARAGELTFVLVPLNPASGDPRIDWLISHCTPSQVEPKSQKPRFETLNCSPAKAR
jgi:4-amino-4-deoxy-L-arabinose transferase-like glycosyltransferase